ncbi:MAG TPA: YkvA family protein [Thermoanaerobaculia bacterium]|nr:YkvA family protein [Thermoanaerobaculia bacterium]
MEETDTTLSDMTEAAAPVTDDRAQRFYDRIRNNIRRYLETKAHLGETPTKYLLLAPDVFMLLWRLISDGRVNAKNKVLLGSGLAYYFFPLDIMPEAFLGPIGYLDDLVFGVYLLNKMLADTDPAILRQHWSGSDDVLTTIQNVLSSADNLVGSDILSRIKKMMK